MSRKDSLTRESLTFHSPEIEKALQNSLGVFDRHLDQIAGATSDIQNLEKLLTGRRVGLPYSFQCSLVAPKDEILANVELRWERTSAGPFRLLFKKWSALSDLGRLALSLSSPDKNTEAVLKPAAEAPIEVRLKIHSILPVFIEAFAEFLRSRETVKEPLKKVEYGIEYDLSTAGEHNRFNAPTGGSPSSAVAGTVGSSDSRQWKAIEEALRPNPNQ